MTVGDGSFLSAHASATTHPMSVQPKKMLSMGNPVEGERDSGLKPNTIPL